MWSSEDLFEMNPPEAGQATSFLSQLLHMGATTLPLLSEFATYLENQEGSFVAAFAQLPFSLDLPEGFISTPGDAPHSLVKVSLRRLHVRVDEFGRLTPLDSRNHEQCVGPDSLTITQGVGIVCLGDKRSRLHKAYLNRLAHIQSLDEPMGKVENWMRLPQTRLQEPLRQQAPLTGHDFQRDVAARAKEHFHFALNAVLHAFSVANLEELPLLDELYGYHVMIAPGQVACAERPVPVIKGLLPQRSSRLAPPIAFESVSAVLASQRRLEDRVLRQLIAMNRLLENGEAPLALIGCITAIEWFLNDRFPDLARQLSDGSRRSGSVSDFLKSKHSKFLTTRDRELLRKMVHARNAVTHGAPPDRTKHGRNQEIDPQFVRESLFLALGIYRTVNTLASASVVA